MKGKVFMIKALGSRLDLSTEEGKQSEYYTLVADLMESSVVKGMNEYMQHGCITTFQHCLNVSYYNYLICKLLSLNARAAARAGLLHDLFLYDWHTHKTPAGGRNHAFSHPGTALANAEKYFALTDVEKDIIAKHMFPVTVSMPGYRETWVIILTDKFCALIETAAGMAYKARHLFTRSSVGSVNN